MNPLERIRLSLERADNLEGEADDLRWRAAEEMVALLDGGMTTRELATELDKSQSFVTQYARVWREYHGTQNGQTFGALLRLVKHIKDPVEREIMIEEANSKGKSVATIQDHRSYIRSPQPVRSPRMIDPVPPREPSATERQSRANLDVLEAARQLGKAVDCLDEAIALLHRAGDDAERFYSFLEGPLAMADVRLDWVKTLAKGRKLGDELAEFLREQA